MILWNLWARLRPQYAQLEAMARYNGIVLGSYITSTIRFQEANKVEALSSGLAFRAQMAASLADNDANDRVLATATFFSLTSVDF